MSDDELDFIPIDSPLGRLSGAHGDDARDIRAALAALIADGYTEDEVWDFVSQLPIGVSIVDEAARRLGRGSRR